MKQSEIFALNQWLSWFDDSLNYQQVIDLMIDPENTWSCDQIDVWQAVETFTLDQVAVFIEDTRTAFEQAINHMGITA
jgi:hypothetical protein